ncbi:ATPase, T2SS/T4P/T4SS family, partial [Corynebacterium bovis]
TLADLGAAGMFPPEVGDALDAAVTAGRSILVSGGTGAGKTTLLTALLARVPGHERLIQVEDTRELHPDHPHVVSLTTRTGTADGAGEVTVRDLVRQCLRMRPDRIIVGEIRGAEIADLLLALNTGHRGSGATVHANSVAAVPARLGALGALAAARRDVDDPPAELVLPAGHRRPQELDAQVTRFAPDEGELHDGVGHRLLVEREHLHDDLDRPLPGRQ